MVSKDLLGTTIYTETESKTFARQRMRGRGHTACKGPKALKSLIQFKVSKDLLGSKEQGERGKGEFVKIRKGVRSRILKRQKKFYTGE